MGTTTSPPVDDGSLIITEPLGPLTHDTTAQSTGGGGIVTQPIGGAGGAPSQYQPGWLGRQWTNLKDFATGIGQTVEGTMARTPTTAIDFPGQKIVSSPGDTADFDVGVKRGVRNVTDKVAETLALTPTTTIDWTNGRINQPPPDVTDISSQNAADRAQWQKTYGGNPKALAGQAIGEVMAASPAVVPAVMAGEGLMGAAGIDLLTDYAGSGIVPALTRSVGRLIQRGVSGGVGGGTQSAVASDPTKDFWPQVASGAITGGLLAPGFGAISDITSNIGQRVTGGYVPVNQQSAEQLGNTVARANNAQILIDHDVPVQASQVSTDPVLTQTAKFGGAMPFSGQGDFIDNQLQRFRQEALKKANPDAPDATNATKQWQTDTQNAITNKYANSIEAVPSVPSDLRIPGPPSPGTTGTPVLRLQDEFAQIRQNLPVMTDEQRALVEGALDKIETRFAVPQGNTSPPGYITGSDAQDILKRSGTFSSLYNSDSAAVRDVGNQIADIVRKRVTSQMTPDQLQLYNQANSQTRALHTISEVADANGSFTPAQLNDQAVKVANTWGGTGAVDVLARAGDSVITPTLEGKPGTAGRIASSVGGAGLSGALGAGAALKLLTSGGGLALGGIGTAAGIPGGLALNSALQAINRRMGQRAINTVLQGGGYAPSFSGRAGPIVLNATSLLGTALDQSNQEK